VFTRKHHCRRCGLIYCDDCSSCRDDVDHPAHPPGEPDLLNGARNQRVCVTCTTNYH
jgi:hypothetical protein